MKKENIITTTTVVQKQGDKFSKIEVDLKTSTISWHCGVDLTFCYYKEITAQDVLAGMTPVGTPYENEPDLVFFIKLTNNIPVDLGIRYVKSVLNKHPGYI